MACGVHLGILLICLLQAEHVCCLWATEAQNSKTQNSDTYVGFLQQDNSLRRLGASYPQDQFRQDSISPAQSSSSFYSQTAVNRGYNNQRLSQPAQGSYTPATLVQSSSDLKPNWRMTKSKQVNIQKPPFGLSTAIASGSSVSKYSKRQAGHSEGRRSWPTQQGTQRTGQYQPSSFASVQSPSRERGYYSSSSHQAGAQTSRSAPAKTPPLSVQRGYSSPAKTSSLFRAGDVPPQHTPVKMQTSARAPARRVFSQQHSKASLPTRFTSTQPERASYETSQTAAGKPYPSRLFPTTGGDAQGHYKPTSTMTSSHVSFMHSVPARHKQNAPVGQRLNTKPSYTSTEQTPRRASSVQALGRSMKPTQGARNLPAGTSSQRFAPTKTLSIPQRFGGFAIRRLKDPEEVGVQKPQSYTAPQPPTYRPQAPQPAASYRPQAPQPAASYRPQAPQPTASYRPQALQPTASYRPQAPSVHRASTWKRIKPGHSQVQQVQ